MSGALTQREARLALALAEATLRLRAEVECLDDGGRDGDGNFSSEGERLAFEQALRELDADVALLEGFGVSIDHLDDLRHMVAHGAVAGAGSVDLVETFDTTVVVHTGGLVDPLPEFGCDRRRLERPYRDGWI